MKDINLLLLLLLFFLKQIFKLYLSVVYLGVSGARHKNERDCKQSEEKQTGGVRQKYRSVQYLKCEQILQQSLQHCR